MTAYGIFPTPSDLGLTIQDYWFLCGSLGIVCGYVFWDRIFK